MAQDDVMDALRVDKDDDNSSSNDESINVQDSLGVKDDTTDQETNREADKDNESVKEEKVVEQQTKKEEGENDNSDDDNALSSLAVKEEVTEEKKSEYYKEFGYEDEHKFKEDFEQMKKIREEHENKEDVQLPQLDETLARLSVLKGKEDKKDYEFFKDVVLNDNLSAEELVAIDLAQKFPDFSDEDISDYILEKYGLEKDSEEYDLLDDKEKSRFDRKLKAGQMRLTEDANNVKEKLMDEFNGIELPTNAKQKESADDIIKQKEQAKNAWAQYSDDIVKNAGKFSFKFNVGDKELELDYSVDEKKSSEYNDMLLNMVYQNNIGVDEKSAKATYEILKNTMLAENHQSIMQAMADKVSEYFSEHWENELNHPSKRGIRKIEQKDDSGETDYGRANFLKLLND